MKTVNQISMTLIVVVLLLAPSFPVHAHSTGIAQLVAVEVGDCLVSVWTWPEPLKTSAEVHIAVLLTEKTDPGTTGDIILNSTVNVLFTPESGESPMTSRATHEQADVKFFYETKVRLRDEGTYNIAVDVADATWNCQGRVEFFQAVVAPTLSMGWLALIGGSALAGAGYGYYQWQQKRTGANEAREQRGDK